VGRRVVADEDDAEGGAAEAGGDALFYGRADVGAHGGGDLLAVEDLGHGIG
jgi:hypothetical protein